jgi:hypothetical protein
MLYGVLADLTAVVHFAFVVGVVFGGLLVLRWPRAAWVHIPIALWGVAIEWGGWICPLTPLENHLRRLAGEGGYEGGFVERYVLAALYPEGLTRELQFVLGAAVLVLNLAVYTLVWRRRRARLRRTDRGQRP